MHNHGGKPKNVWVRAYEQMRKRGKVAVRAHPRHISLRLRCLASEDQLCFDF